MNRFGKTAAWLAALAMVAGCASSAPAPAIDDAAITAGVKAAVAADAQLASNDIEVDTAEGIVRLSGFVSSAEDVATAAAAARTVKGVQSVRNDLRLR
ncbi:BON domain-containing protein [uncultured Massilia sp.]|uniref:BON domain-containing protein n=1 Tax=uncultured Massilia sp. TaxID=169973 RepID=UPI0025D8467B|nr:BON domain-containing protein [uncultured Massilia sp.]